MQRLLPSPEVLLGAPITFFLDLLQVTHMIDNEGTVIFAMFMAIWGRCQRLSTTHTELARRSSPL